MWATSMLGVMLAFLQSQLFPIQLDLYFLLALQGPVGDRRHAQRYHASLISKFSLNYQTFTFRVSWLNIRCGVVMKI